MVMSTTLLYAWLILIWVTLSDTLDFDGEIIMTPNYFYRRRVSGFCLPARKTCAWNLEYMNGHPASVILVWPLFTLYFGKKMVCYQLRFSSCYYFTIIIIWTEGTSLDISLPPYFTSVAAKLRQTTSSNYEYLSRVPLPLKRYPQVPEAICSVCLKIVNLVYLFFFRTPRVLFLPS